MMTDGLAVCRTPLSKWQIMQSIMSNGVKTININGIAVVLLAVEREDGSGNCFNLTLAQDGKRYKCFVRCKG